jgi:hypothetical protein
MTRLTGELGRTVAVFVLAAAAPPMLLVRSIPGPAWEPFMTQVVLGRLAWAVGLFALAGLIPQRPRTYAAAFLGIVVAAFPTTAVLVGQSPTTAADPIWFWLGVSLGSVEYAVLLGLVAVAVRGLRAVVPRAAPAGVSVIAVVLLALAVTAMTVPIPALGSPPAPTPAPTEPPPDAPAPTVSAGPP